VHKLDGNAAHDHASIGGSHRVVSRCRRCNGKARTNALATSLGQMGRRLGQHV